MIIYPTFKYEGFKMNPNNLYIIDEVWYRKDAPLTDILSVAAQAKQLASLGFVVTPNLKEFPIQHKLYRVSLIDHPVLGIFGVGIVDGPDYQTMYEAMDTDFLNKLIEEKAKFKLNIHPQNFTRQ